MGTVLEVGRLLRPDPDPAPRLRGGTAAHRQPRNGATAADPVGCRGINVGDHTACLAHLNAADRAAYLAGLSPGADIDWVDAAHLALHDIDLSRCRFAGAVHLDRIVLTTDTPDPVNPSGPLTERVTTERFEKSLRAVINSVILRSSGQDLTTTGTYTEMISRLAEPVLLGLAVLAVRSRVKR